MSPSTNQHPGVNFWFKGKRPELKIEGRLFSIPEIWKSPRIVKFRPRPFSISKCTSAPNFIEIGQFLAEILWRSRFENGSCPPSWIFEILLSEKRDLWLCVILLLPSKFCINRNNMALRYGQKRFSVWCLSTVLDLANFDFSSHKICFDVPNFVEIW